MMIFIVLSVERVTHIAIFVTIRLFKTILCSPTYQFDIQLWIVYAALSFIYLLFRKKKSTKSFACSVHKQKPSTGTLSTLICASPP